MKLKYIDALRGIAILGVIAVHTGQSGYNKYPRFFSQLIEQGAKGVQLFFVISAFTLFLSYKKREKIEHCPVQNFFIRRFFRIAPLYYLGILYYLKQDGWGPRFWLGNQENVTLLGIASNFFFAHGANPHWMLGVVPGGWSITIEMTFYLTIPWLIKQIKSLNLTITFTLISWVLALILNYTFQIYPFTSSPQLWKNYLYLYFPNQLPVFGFGIIAYFLIIVKDYRVSPLNLCLMTTLLLSHLVWKASIPEHLFFALGFLLLVVVLSRQEYFLLVNGFTRFMGRISYSAYLIHFAVIHWLTIFHWADLLPTPTTTLAILNYFIRLVIIITITALLSWLSLRLLEKPTQNIGKYLIKLLEQKIPDSSHKPGIDHS